MLQKLKNNPTLWKFVKFCMIGALNTAVDYGVFALLVRVLHVDALVAQVISYSCGVVNSYAWNRSFTFRSKTRFFSATAIRFLAANLTTLGLSLISMYLLTSVAGLDELLAKLPTMALTIGVNFLLSHLWVFRQKEGSSVAGE